MQPGAGAGPALAPGEPRSCRMPLDPRTRPASSPCPSSDSPVQGSLSLHFRSRSAETTSTAAPQNALCQGGSRVQSSPRHCCEMHSSPQPTFKTLTPPTPPASQRARECPCTADGHAQQEASQQAAAPSSLQPTSSGGRANYWSLSRPSEIQLDFSARDTETFHTILIQ